MKFLYLDECKDVKHTNIISLTGIISNADGYQLLRDCYYKAIMPYIKTAPNTYNMSPPEIHGSSLLPEVTDDDEKLRVVRELSEGIVNSDTRVYRIGFYAKQDLMDLFLGEDGILKMSLSHFFNLCCEEYKTDLLIPVMDSVNKPIFDAFSRHIKNSDILQRAEMPNMIRTEGDSNICEMHYIDSAHSALMQMTDIASYLLHTEDYIRTKKKLSPFKEKLMPIAEFLSQAVVKNEVRKIKVLTQEEVRHQNG